MIPAKRRLHPDLRRAAIAFAGMFAGLVSAALLTGIISPPASAIVAPIG